MPEKWKSSAVRYDVYANTNIARGSTTAQHNKQLMLFTTVNQLSYKDKQCYYSQPALEQLLFTNITIELSNVDSLPRTCSVKRVIMAVRKPKTMPINRPPRLTVRKLPAANTYCNSSHIILYTTSALVSVLR